MAKRIGKFDSTTGQGPAAVENRLVGLASTNLQTEGTPANTYLKDTIESVVAASGGGVPFDGVVALGTSIVEMAPWETFGETLFGVPVINAGKSGYGPMDIGFESGALDPVFTLPGNFPASGSVTATAIAPATSWRFNGSGSYIQFSAAVATIIGTGEEIPVTVRHYQQPSESWQITRTTPGSAIAAPSGISVHIPALDAYRSWLWVIDLGRNGLPTNGNPDDTIKMIDLIIRHLTTDRYIVMGVTNSLSEGVGTSNYNVIVGHEALLEKRVAEKFVNQRAEMVDRGMRVIGLTPTTTDRINIANGIIPTSMHRIDPDTSLPDTLHFTQDTGEFQIRLARQRAAENGEIAGLIPAVAPAAPTGLAAGTPTSTTIPLSWTSQADALSYTIEYRLHSGGAWVWAGSTESTSFTPTGLLGGSAYDLGVTAENIDGSSNRAVLSNVSTTGSAPVLLFSDAFTRADGNLQNSTADNTLGGASFVWGASAAARVVANAVGRVTADTTVRYGPGPTTPDDEMRVEIKLTTPPADSVGFGPMLSYADANNYAYAYVTVTGSITIGSRVTGVNGSQSGSADGVIAVGDRLAVGKVGDVVTAYVNDLPVVSRTITGLTGTIAGLRLPIANTWRGVPFKVFDK